MSTSWDNQVSVKTAMSDIRKVGSLKRSEACIGRNRTFTVERNNDVVSLKNVANGAIDLSLERKNISSKLLTQGL